MPGPTRNVQQMMAIQLVGPHRMNDCDGELHCVGLAVGDICFCLYFSHVLPQFFPKKNSCVVLSTAYWWCVLHFLGLIISELTEG